VSLTNRKKEQATIAKTFDGLTRVEVMAKRLEIASAALDEWFEVCEAINAMTPKLIAD